MMPVIDHCTKVESSVFHCCTRQCHYPTRPFTRPLRSVSGRNNFRDAPFAGGIPSERQHIQRQCSGIGHNGSAVLASSRSGPQQGSSATAGRKQQKPTSTPPGGGGDPRDDLDDKVSLQIRLDPFSQQLTVSALTGAAAWIVAALAGVDLSSALHLDMDSLAIALQLSAPVLLLLLAVLAPRWAPPFKGPELERLHHNYYMTAQVLQLYLNFDDDEDEEGDGPGGGGGERGRVRRRLRLEQTVGWSTIRSGLALMQAFTLQPWNPPTANSVFAFGLAGRSVQQLANEFLVRGAGWGLLSGWVARELLSADASDGILFYGKIFGGPDAVKYAAGLGLVALALPGALWDARAAKNFVRASVVGPVRDAAIFCTGNGVDEPAYCDPAGFAMMAVRRPANAAFVADVVTRTRGWWSGPEASFSSSSGVRSMDELELRHGTTTATPTMKAVASGEGRTTTAMAVAEHPREHADGGATAASTATPATLESSPGSSPSPSGPSAVLTPSSATLPPAGVSSQGSSADIPNSDSDTSSSSAAAASNRSDGSTSGNTSTSRSTAASNGNRSSNGVGPSGHGAAAAGSSSPQAPLGASVLATSTTFEWDSEDMSVLLRVETLQDKIAFWSCLYYQLLAAFAINGAFLASDGNLLASFGTAWLLRTGPLVLAELRARAAAGAAMRG